MNIIVANCDTKQWSTWLGANKTSLNIEKNEQAIFKSPQKYFLMKSNLNVTDKGIYPTNSVKYIGVLRIDKLIYWHDQVNDNAVKLNRTNKNLKIYLLCSI